MKPEEWGEWFVEGAGYGGGCGGGYGAGDGYGDGGGFQLGKTEYGEDLGRHILELASTTGLEPVSKEDP